MTNTQYKNRYEWNELYGYYFDKEKDFQKTASKIEITAVIISILNTFIPLLSIFIAIALSFLILLLSISLKLFEFLALKNRTRGEMGRRTSFYKDLVPISRLTPTINNLRRDAVTKAKYSDPDWYGSILGLDKEKQIYFDFLHGLYFQNNLMMKYEKKLYKKLIPLLVISICSFIPVLLVDINLRIIFWSIFIIIFLLFTNECLKTLKFKKQASRVNEIYKESCYVYRGRKPNRHGHGNDKPSFWAMGYQTLQEMIDNITDDEWTAYRKIHNNCCGTNI